MKKKCKTPRYANGGRIPDTKINIEGVNQKSKYPNSPSGELLVNPDGKILKDYSAYAPHPKDESQINPNSNVMETPNNFVIPKRLAKRFKEGDKLTRNTLLMNLAKQDREKRMKNGGQIERYDDVSQVQDPNKSSGFDWKSMLGGMNSLNQPTSTDYSSASSYYGETNQANIEQQYGAADKISSGLPGAAIGMGIGRGIRTRAEAMDSEGNLKNEKKARRTAVLGGILSPSSALAARSSYKGGFKFNKGNLDGSNYTASLEANSQMDNRNNMFNEYPDLFKKGGRIPKYENGGGTYSQSFDRYKKPYDPNFRFYNSQPESRNSGIPTTSVEPYTSPYTDYSASFNPLPQNNNKVPYRGDNRRIANTGSGDDSSSMPQNERTGSNGVGRALVNAGLNAVGPLSYLLGEGKNYDRVNYGRLNPDLLDPRESLREADLQNIQYNEDLKSGAGGNSGAYLSNRLAAISKTTQNKNKIRADFSNTNTGIKNQYKNFNKDLQIKSMNDEAMNKGQSETNFYSAIGNLGHNSASSLGDTRNNESQEEVYQRILEMYPNLKKRRKK